MKFGLSGHSGLSGRSAAKPEAWGLEFGALPPNSQLLTPDQRSRSPSRGLRVWRKRFLPAAKHPVLDAHGGVLREEALQVPAETDALKRVEEEEALELAGGDGAEDGAGDALELSFTEDHARTLTRRQQRVKAGAGDYST